MSIELRDVSFAYDGASPLLRGFSLTVPDGSCLALIGQTGSGKSTVLKLMTGVLRPDAGTVLVDERPAWLPGHGLRRRPRRDPGLYRRVGYVMQRPERQLFAPTVAEDVAFGPKNLGLSDREAEQAADEALGYLGVRDLAGASPFELSGGQQRLVAIAGVLAMGPGNLVLDEPMASLDPRGRERMRGLLRRLVDDGVTCVLVTHELDDAAALADSVAVMDDGALVSQGAPGEVFRDAAGLEALGLGVPAPVAFAQRLAGLLGPRAPEALAEGCPLDVGALADVLAGLAPCAHTEGGAS